MEPLEINGHAPVLAGKTCEALLCYEYWYDGNLADPANVIFIRANAEWHKLFFDSGIVFWRSNDTPSPGSFEAPEISGRWTLVDLGNRLQVAGLTILAIEAAPTPGGAAVTMAFDTGRTIVFENANDVTSYVLVSNVFPQ